MTKTRPWGNFTILLDSEICKVKKLMINPGHGISYQYHHKRQEDWTIVSGTGIIRVDDNDVPAIPGLHITILPLQRHTVSCNGEDPLIIIEVQTGTYFGEDDIIRLSDQYGRV